MIRFVIGVAIGAGLYAAGAEAARERKGEIDNAPIGQWSVRFPNHARLVYDANTRTCFCEGSLQDAYDGVVASMKSSLDNCERRLYGKKQFDEWEAEASKREFRWP